MASGDTLQIFYAWNGSSPYSLVEMIFSTVNSATSGECFPVAVKIISNNSYLDFVGVMPDYYSGGGVTCTVIWSYNTTSASSPLWYASFRAMPDDVEDLDLNHSYSYNSVSAGIPSVVGEIGYDIITFTDGADMDNLAAGELFNFRIYSFVATHVMKLLAIHVKET